MTSPARHSAFSERIHRRDLLRIGSLGAVGLALPDLLRAGSRPTDLSPSRIKPPQARSCILFFLEGGPAHQDLWDMKPLAPAEVRGEFQPIASSLAGVTVCEHLPLLSRQMHRLTLIRSVHHDVVDHNAGSYYALTGRSPVVGGKLIVADEPENFPPYGAVLSRLLPATANLPEFVHLPEIMSNNGYDLPGERAGFLGPAYDPLVAGDPSAPGYQVPGLGLPSEIPGLRLNLRRTLLDELDRSAGTLAGDPK